MASDSTSGESKNWKQKIAEGYGVWKKMKSYKAKLQANVDDSRGKTGKVANAGVKLIGYIDKAANLCPPIKAFSSPINTVFGNIKSAADMTKMWQMLKSGANTPLMLKTDVVGAIEALDKQMQSSRLDSRKYALMKYMHDSFIVIHDILAEAEGGNSYASMAEEWGAIWDDRESREMDYDDLDE